MRNALILLVVVALLILTVGALNNGTAFDVDYVAGTVTAVSLFWVSIVLAALVFVVGLAAAWFAQAAVAGTRRKLETELQSTYERLREAEARAARPAPVVVEAAPAVVAEPVVAAATRSRSWQPRTVTVVAGEDATMVAGEEATVIADQPAEAIADEPETVATTAEEPAAEPGEQTAVTMAGAASEDAADRAGGRRGRRRRRRRAGRRRTRCVRLLTRLLIAARVRRASVAPGRYTRA